MLEFHNEEGKEVTDEVEFDHVFFKLKLGDYADQSFTLEFDVCPDPTCPCEYLRCEVTPQGEAQEPCGFGVDVKTRQLHAEDETLTAEVRRLAVAVIAELTDDDWEELENVFYTAKSDLSEVFDIEECRPQFPDQDDKLFFYDEIFPFAEPFIFTDKMGTELAAIDSYPVDDVEDPGCEMMLLIHTADVDDLEDSDEEIEKDALAIIVDYDKERLVQVEKSSSKYDADALLPSLVEGHADLWQRLRSRHGNLQKLYAKYGVGQPKKHQPATSLKKAGRNDLCPCGSGKKHKKCCGR